MAHEENRATLAGDVAHLAEALPLELHVTDGEDFVNDEDLGVQVGRHGEREAHFHSGGISFDRLLQERLHAGERRDLVVLRADLAPRHPQNGSA